MYYPRRNDPSATYDGPDCACGCGKRTRYPTSRFLPGHQSRLKENQKKPKPRRPLTCAQCSTMFTARQPWLEDTAKFCSRACANRHRLGDGRIANRTCEVCGTRFRISRAKIAKGKGRFCSKKCFSSTRKTRPGPRPCECGCGTIVTSRRGRFRPGHANRLRQNWRKPLNRPPKVCEHCSRPYTPGPGRYAVARFCSRACASNHHHGATGHAGVDVTCLYCGTPFHTQKSMIARGWGKFCSRACHSQWSRSQERPSAYRSNAWRNFDRRCYDCGFDKEPRIVVIHHIDGNHQNGKMENLIPVCPNCHAIRHIALDGHAAMTPAVLRWAARSKPEA